MQPGGYHDAIWEALPEGVQPPYARLRSRFLLAQLAAVADPHRPARALDAGCGEGHFAAALARAGAQVVGADVSARALERARRLHPGLELCAVPEHGEWPLADASFDLVWAGETIEHVADTTGWLSQVRRVLKPGGALALSTPAHDRLELLALVLSRTGFERRFHPRSDHLRFYTRRSLRELLADFDFERVSVRGAAGLPGARRLLLASARRPQRRRAA